MRVLDILQRHGMLCNSTLTPKSDTLFSLVCVSVCALRISLTSASVAVSATRLKVSYYT